LWEAQFVTVSWFVTDLTGETVLSYGMGNFGRPELLLFEDFDIDYLDFESREADIELPRRWRATLSGEDGRLEYEVKALGQEYDPSRPQDSFLMPNPILSCNGRLTTPDGEALKLTGVGLPEYHVAHLGPLDLNSDRQSK
jgi:hypothetical protein